MDHQKHGPAFPVNDWVGNAMTIDEANQLADYKGPHPGMSLRDHFAECACPVVVSHFVNLYLSVCRTNEPEEWGDNALAYSLGHMERVAKIEARYRYALADAMLKERERSN